MPGRFHGFLVIDKPAGWTSHDVVARVRRLLNEKRVGHAGTLDPAATGVLPVAVGHATKSIEWLEHAQKSYLAEITFGVATDSCDADGVVIGVGDAGAVTRDALEAALPPFRGAISQTPPIFSAIKIGGKKLYELARKGETIEIPSRSITIHQLELVDWRSPVATVFVECSKGTYIRSIARDLGEALDVPAHLSNLVRLASGPFAIDEAWTLGDLAEADLEAEWESIAIHPDAAAAHLDAMVMDDDGYEEWRHGRTIPASSSNQEADVRVYSREGLWVGIARIDAGASRARPLRVITDAA
jgi:tRNA pseudouridine55 synthase